MVKFCFRNIALYLVVNTCLSIFCFTDHGYAESLAQKAQLALDQNKPKGAYELIIESSGSKIILEGKVASQQLSSEIENTVKQVKGVTKINNYLVVDPTFSHQSGAALTSESNSPIVSKIKQAIKSLPLLNDYKIRIALEDTKVTLSGAVKTDQDKDRILAKAKESTDLNVEDAITVEREFVNDYVLYQRVLSATEKYPAAHTLHYTAKNGVITITGTVSNHRDLDQVLSTILMVDGVLDIKSEVVNR